MAWGVGFEPTRPFELAGMPIEKQTLVTLSLTGATAATYLCSSLSPEVKSFGGSSGR